MYKHMGVHTYTYVRSDWKDIFLYWLIVHNILPLVYLTIIEFKIFAWTTTFQGSQQLPIKIAKFELFNSITG